MGVTDGDSIEGVSGSGVLNTQNQVVGVHTNSFLFSSGNRPGFIRFNQDQIKWLNGIINANKVSGWKQYNGSNYYFQDNGRLIRNTRTIIDGEEYDFDINGKATLKQQTEVTQTTSSSTTNSTSSSTTNSTSSSSTNTTNTTSSSSTTSTSSSSSSSTSSSSNNVKPKISTNTSTSTKNNKNKKTRTKKNNQTQKKNTGITLILTTTCIICFLIGLGGTIYINRK